MLDQLNTAIGFVSVMLLLSMVITVVVQAISALLDLRGHNLVWGLATLFNQIAPEAAKKIGKGLKLVPPGVNTAAQELAKAVASHSALNTTATGGLFKAKAIRVDELLAVLQEIATEPDAVKGLSDAAQSLLKSLFESMPGTNANAESMQQLAASFAQRFPVHKEMLQDALMDIAGRTTRAAAGVERWFKTVMDRANDRFARNCRAWTIIGAAVFAFGFHVNALNIFRSISSNPDIRAKLAANADSLAQQAAREIGNLGSKAIATLRDDANSNPPKINLQPDEKDALSKAPETLVNCSQARDWLRGQDALKNDQNLMDGFETACTDAAKKQLATMNENLSGINKQLSDADLKLFDDFDLRFREFYIKEDIRSQLGGEVLTILLLSLGAPFWFNALKQLSNLKPSLSSKVDQERAAAQPPADQQKAKTAGSGA
jgi:hypothetical protein